jgi:hypothetical protein
VARFAPGGIANYSLKIYHRELLAVRNFQFEMFNEKFAINPLIHALPYKIATAFWG